MPANATPRTSEITVRVAHHADVEVIADLHFRSAEVAFTSFVPRDRPVPTRADLAQDWITRLTDGPRLKRVAFVAELRGTIVGVVEAGLEPTDHELGRLSRCYIDPGTWGTRVASQLFDAAVAHMRELGCTTAVGWVMEHNSRSRDRIEHLGMTPTGRRQSSCEPAVPSGIEDVQYRLDLYMVRPGPLP